MTTDIKERLRDMAGKKYNHTWAGWVQQQCGTAADYIEQLEKALQFYADGKHVKDGIGWDSQPTIEDGEVARTALAAQSGINPKS